MFWPDVINLKQFYATALGQIACESVRRGVRKLWPSVKGETVMGIGFPTPYLMPMLDSADQVIACMPAPQGIIHWPHDGEGKTFLSDEGELPLPDNSVNRVLLVHALENTEQRRRMIQEIWRVLTPTGRLLVIAPNRTGIWARSPSSPFAHGQPFTPFQLRNLLYDNSFTPLQHRMALFFFPSHSRFLLRSAKVMENTGKYLFRAFAGVILMEAEKQIYAPTKQAASSRMRGQIYAPAAKPVMTREVG